MRRSFATLPAPRTAPNAFTRDHSDGCSDIRSPVDARAGRAGAADFLSHTNTVDAFDSFDASARGSTGSGAGGGESRHRGAGRLCATERGGIRGRLALREEPARDVCRARYGEQQRPFGELGRH